MNKFLHIENHIINTEWVESVNLFDRVVQVHLENGIIFDFPQESEEIAIIIFDKISEKLGAVKV